MLCDDLEGWDGGEWERSPRKRGYMCVYIYMYMADSVHCQEKIIQHCKAIIF